MARFTVIGQIPDGQDGGWNSNKFFCNHKNCATPLRAVELVLQEQADMRGFEPEDLKVIGVFPGHHDNIMAEVMKNVPVS